MKNRIVVLILIGLIGWGVFDSQRDKANETISDSDLIEGEIGLLKGNLAPNFELETLDGEPVKLSDFRGEKVILNLWATWCPPCRVEMPHMQDYYEDFKDDGVTILAVNLTTRERNGEVVQTFVNDEFQLTFPVVMDMEGQVGDLYQVFSIPTTYMIDTQGIIQDKVIGPMSYEMMENMVNRLE